VFGLSFPCRQQARRLRRAGASGAAAIVAGALAATAASVGATALAGMLALVMVALVCEAVGDRLGHSRCVAVEGADRERGEPAGLPGVLDSGWRVGGR